MHPPAMKVQRNGHKCHAAIPSQKAKTVNTRSISFSFTAAVQTMWLSFTAAVQTMWLSFTAAVQTKPL